MIKSAVLTNQIIVQAVNKKGTLADIAKLTSEHGINIEAMAGYVADGDTATLMLVTDDERRTVDLLKEHGYQSVHETKVIYIEIESKPGALKVISDKLADNDIDIKYNYGTTSSDARYSRMVLGTSDNEKAVVLFQKFTEE